MTLWSMWRLLAALLFFVVLSGPAAAQEATVAPAPAPTLSEIESVEQLRDLFNQQAGMPRLILLLSPT